MPFHMIRVLFHPGNVGIHSFQNYLPNTYDVPGIAVSPGEIARKTPTLLSP